MNGTNNLCPCCGRHCDLSAPACGRGEEYARTGVIPEKKDHGHRGHWHHKNLMKSEQYIAMDTEERLFSILQELGHYCRFYFDGKGGQGRILQILSREGEISQRDLTEQLNIQPGSASEVLGKLENAGWIERVPDTADKRTVTVRLTEEGRSRAAGLDSDRDARIHALFAELSGEEKRQMLGLTEKLFESWRQAKSAHGSHHREA